MYKSEHGEFLKRGRKRLSCVFWGLEDAPCVGEAERKVSLQKLYMRWSLGAEISTGRDWGKRSHLEGQPSSSKGTVRRKQRRIAGAQGREVITKSPKNVWQVRIWGEKVLRDLQGLVLGWLSQDIQSSGGGCGTEIWRGENYQPEGESQEELVWAGLLGRTMAPVSE